MRLERIVAVVELRTIVTIKLSVVISNCTRMYNGEVNIELTYCSSSTNEANGSLLEDN